MSAGMHVRTYIPYLLDLTPRLSHSFVRLLIESSYYSKAVFIKLGVENEEIHCPKEGSKVEWLQMPGSQLKRHCNACHCNRYRAWGIRPLRRFWRGRRWVGWGL